METETALARIVAKIEQARGLDVAAAPLQGAARAAFGSAGVHAVLSGAPLGHRLHPALVSIPIGSWLCASMLDLTAGNPAAAQRLVGFGCLTALPTAAAGATDWLDTTGADRRTGLVHALLNDLALLVYTSSWRSRRRGHHARGIGLALAGSGILASAAWLGGHLAYTRGVGVSPAPTKDPHDAHVYAAPTSAPA